MYTSPVLSSNMYVLLSGGHALIIDPHEDPCLREDVHVDLILLTHEHFDHISGIEHWRKLTGAPAMGSAACALGCKTAKGNLSRYSKMLYEFRTTELVILPVAPFSVEIDKTYEGRDEFRWQGHSVVLFECPGHSPGGTGILVDETLLFSGDSLFKDVETSCALPGGNRRDWIEKSLPKLLELSGDIRVLPGHYKPFLLSECGWWAKAKGAL
ncbi:MBL fold metallo-hydrolase [Adlercreutzia sp. ZJ138]|uniref:MBL fold metallo-hydrolase n=1 Tax=Adlercreutzia sp. ZJ138 TaxID=2709405 RepID=UPI00351ABD6C